MTDHEKLFRLLLKAFSLDSTIGLDWNECSLFFPNVKLQEAIDYLLENGVTVREPQKPLAYSKVFHSHCLEPQWWVELKNGDIFCSRDEVGTFFLDCYGKTWRCWAEKPTEEERKAAAWGK